MKRCLLRASVRTRESHAPSAAYWYAPSAAGGYKRTYGRKQKNVLCRAVVKIINVHGGTIAVRVVKIINVPRIMIILKYLTGSYIILQQS